MPESDRKDDLPLPMTPDDTAEGADPDNALSAAGELRYAGRRANIVKRLKALGSGGAGVDHDLARKRIVRELRLRDALTRVLEEGQIPVPDEAKK